jgi:hypothetical protein
MWNTGIDFSTKNNRVSGSLEYYQKYSFDLLEYVNLDPTVGFTSVRQNSAAIKGKGIDLVLNTLKMDRQVKWKTLLVFNYVSYKVTKNLAAPSTDGFVSNGASIFPVLGYNPYTVASYKWAGLDPLTGDPMGYVNGQVSKDYAAISRNPVEQQVVHGSALAPFFGSLRNTLEWKGFSLALTITYQMGHYFRRPSLNYSSLFQSGSGYSEFEKRWIKTGDELYTNVPSMIYPANAMRDNFYNQSEINVEKADHIRLEDIFLSYDIKPSNRKFLFSSAQLYFYTNRLNLLLWKANHAGLDPEIIYGIKPSVTLAGGIKLNF